MDHPEQVVLTAPTARQVHQVAQAVLVLMAPADLLARMVLPEARGLQAQVGLPVPQALTELPVPAEPQVRQE